MGRKGAMVSFEWPSESRLLGYIADKGNATYSTRHFRALLSNIAKECNVDSITIIGHSAGTPIVVNALRELRLLDFDLPAEQVRAKYSIGRVVLAAPDMDLMAFTNAVQDRFHDLTTGVAVYASPKDRALGLSEKLYGNSRLGRAVGKIEPFERQLLQSVPKIELVDASVAEKEFGSALGHSYFHRDPWVSSDIGSFILGRSPAGRGLVKNHGDQVFWEFPKDYPEQLKQRIGGAQGVPSNYPNQHLPTAYPYQQAPAGYGNQQVPTDYSNQLLPLTGAPQRVLGNTSGVEVDRTQVIEGLAPASELINSKPWRAN